VEGERRKVEAERGKNSPRGLGHLGKKTVEKKRERACPRKGKRRRGKWLYTKQRRGGEKCVNPGKV